MFDECMEYPPDTRPKIVCSEKNSKITFLNEKNLLVAKIRIDGCVINDNNTRKCDYLLLCNSEKIAAFVELKGTKVMDAVAQIESTLDNTEIKTKLATYKQSAYVALVKQNPSFNTQIQQAKMRLAKKHCSLKLENSGKEFKFPEAL